ncbi:hypothetical protein ABCS02_00935 [Microbacterium sp. X-17]|uniref:hypothetical protein n=1 Tax=Microbacterium sp. X-17 TaxID=3144404 RepID=UPI0031F5A789
MRTRTLVPAVLGLTALAAVALGTGPAYRALNDGADFVIGAEAADSTAIGALDLVTIDPRGVVSTGVASAPDFVPIPGDGEAPGHTVRLDVGVADNDPDTAAGVAVAVLPLGDDGTGRVGTAPNLTPLLRVTVVDTTTGRLLIGGSATDPSRGVPVADASAMLDRLAPREADPLPDGADWTPGAAGSRHDLAVEVYCPDTPAVRALSGPESDLSLMLSGAAVP